MVLTVHIPYTDYYTVYARGRLMGQSDIAHYGTDLFMSGAAVVYYTYPHHRRAYIIRHGQDMKHHRLYELPNIKEKVGVIYYMQGKKIDLLRRVTYNLEALHGQAVYEWDTLFWQKVGCLLDGGTGTFSASAKSNLMVLCNNYKIMKHELLPKLTVGA
ncbi:MAG: hypothetical protein LBS97_03685 [Treponema sp.]|jgi:hypothetical protein|nr:hypothetical protein [Treponema sp.]